MKLLLLLVVAATVGRTSSFTPRIHRQRIAASSRSLPALRALDPAFLAELSAARAAFGLCFFGAAGSAAMGRSAIPQVWDKYQLTQSLKGQGPSLGGERIALPAVTGYPEDVRLADIQQIVSNNMTVAEMIETYPISGQWPGYLCYETYVKANADSNPLAVRAVFESLSLASNIIQPATAQEALEAYKTDVDLLVENLRKSKALAVSAVLFLFVLLGLADYFALYHLYRGWFPEWPGAIDFPSALFDKDVGLFAIPKYWIGDPASY